MFNESGQFLYIKKSCLIFIIFFFFLKISDAFRVFFSSFSYELIFLLRIKIEYSGSGVALLRKDELMKKK